MNASNPTFATVVADYIAEKQATGYRFAKSARVLRSIVELQHQIDGGDPCLSAEVTNRWIEKTPWEKETNRSARISVLRGLALFMARMGYKAVAVPWRLAPLVDYAYTPHIFSEQQLGAVLAMVDCLCERGVSSHSDLVFPLVFRILIGCGTRITETLRIEKKDVDLENGTLVLLNTKNDKQRLIPMAESLTQRCRLYARDNQLVRGFASSRWFFPNTHGLPYDAGTLYVFFRTALRLAGIPHGGRGRGPRMHDLRHTFAVRVLNRWVREGRDLTTALPHLAIYMGHEGLKASQHYLRLTATMFPHLVSTVEKQFGWVIPEAYHG
ncbi:MAG: integrase [Spirochaetaceae bacterium]|nr:MAG: integrase [Spirochaetaceae bacterium]